MKTVDMWPAPAVEADFERSVFMLMGLPVDCLTTRQAVGWVQETARTQRPGFLTTPNLNFLVASMQDEAFRFSVLDSDLVVPDGMPLVWLARALEVPLIERVAGSTMVERLRHDARRPPLKVFFFGGQPGVGQRACEVLLAEQGGLVAVGEYNPGFGSVADMSRPEILERIRGAQPDVVVVSLGAKKGQAWIVQNRAQLQAPVVSHLGAVVNFIAGTVARAPMWMQKTGLEWVWRIWEEPGLLQRYWGDGLAFLGLLWHRAWPCARQMRRKRDAWARLAPVTVQRVSEAGGLRLVLCGRATLMELQPVREAFKACVLEKVAGQDVVLDLRGCAHADSAFMGLMCILLKHQRRLGKRLTVEGASPSLRHWFHLHGADYLLD